MNTKTNLRSFQSALKVIVLATSEDKDRPVLHNVQFIHSPKVTRLQAADGFRAHFIDLDSATGDPCEYLISQTLVKSILGYKIARKDDPEIEFTPAGALVASKVLLGEYDTESQYPDINYIIPRTFQDWFKVNTQDLLSAVKRARVFAREASNVVRLHISPEALIVEGISEELGTAQTVINYAKNTNPANSLLIGFNCDFLIEFLKTVNSETVKIEFNRSTTPAIFTDLNTEAKALVMPMNISTPHFLTPADLKPESDYDSAGAFVYPDSYTQRHPAPDYIPAWYVKPEPVATEPRYFKINDTNVFDRTPEPGAQLSEIKTIWSYQAELRYGTGPKVCILHIVPTEPDPDAAQPVEVVINATRHPLFCSDHITIGSCKQCGNPDHHALYDGVCSPCQAANNDLARQFRDRAFHSQ